MCYINYCLSLNMCRIVLFLFVVAINLLAILCPNKNNRIGIKIWAQTFKKKIEGEEKKDLEKTWKKVCRLGSKKEETVVRVVLVLKSHSSRPF